ncbi:BPSL0067 family protein [Massilia endophytica]|uniref:BPSL0067 family protein n=1 Tax=Massilia endophytica TaxID=2899220 RepID=UPI001E327B46|nr:BPSL0067 family protein [Massilia endophytica]UGQ46657.1 BPSL0067 family protein [Massilia endophytica]
MAFIYKEASRLDKQEKIGDGECVTLIKHFTGAGMTRTWKQGAAVAGNRALREGTAIATFVNGRWRGLAHGNHAAFYLSQVADGVYIVDQWKNNATKPLISRRFIRRLGKDSRGNYIRPTENADAYSVIE